MLGLRFIKQLFIRKTTIILSFLSALLILGYVFWDSEEQTEGTEAPYVNVYNWYGMIPEEVLRQFETETGIKIHYDLYDNNEIVEAKLLSGNSGYDVVFPSASPNIERQIKAGVYQRIDKALIPNLKHLDPVIAEKMNVADPGLVYSVPYYWGTFGFAYIEEAILARMPDAPVDSYRMLFDPAIVSKFKDCGVSLLEEPVDVYPPVLAYLGLNPNSNSPEDLEKAQQHLLKIRPYISLFLASRFVNALVEGGACLVQAWSGEAQLAAEQAKELGRTVRFVVPEEEKIIWIDAMVIPKGAPHPRNAHRFINFMMRPEISAAVSNDILLAIANKDAKPLTNKEVRDNTTIYPRPEIMANLELNKSQSAAYDRLLTRSWAHVRLGRAE